MATYNCYIVGISVCASTMSQKKKKKEMKYEIYRWILEWGDGICYLHSHQVLYIL